MLMATAGESGPELTMTEVLVAKLMRGEQSDGRPLSSHCLPSLIPCVPQ